jgi:succinate-semialdehyde dehydrogenase/glutarate-semialdehyde dehydrogenase
MAAAGSTYIRFSMVPRAGDPPGRKGFLPEPSHARKFAPRILNAINRMGPELSSGTGLYIDGTWRGQTQGGLDVFNPATGHLVGSVVAATKGQVDDAVGAAARAFPDWSGLAIDQRSAFLRSAYQQVVRRSHDLARILTLEQGKPISEAEGEVLWGAEFLLWYAEEIRRPWGEILAPNSSNQRLIARRRPRGVIACITPWNFPSSMILRKVAPAIAAGNTVVVKPAEQTPLSAVAIFEILHEVGLPAGVANLVCGDPDLVGGALTSSPRVRQISFTGSAEVGRIILEGAASTMAKVSLELGGSAPALVFADADLDLAADKLSFSKYQASGQTCIAVNRIYVERSIADKFGNLLAERAAGRRVGNGLEEGVDVGPLIDRMAVSKVRSHLDDAISRGARVLIGGGAPPGLDSDRFLDPTVVVDVPPDALIAREETFGPVAPVIAFDDEQEALELANGTEYGLAAYLFTRDLGRAYRIGEGLDFGMVAVNDGALGWVQAPFGGIKGSGDGREGGRWGLEEFLDVQYLSLNF